MAHIASFVLFLMTLSARAEEPSTPPTRSILTETNVVTLTVPPATERSGEEVRACEFAAMHLKSLGYPVLNMCKAGMDPTTAPMPKPGDPVVVLVFSTISPIGRGLIAQHLPPQVAGSLGNAVVFSPTLGLTQGNLEDDPLLAAVTATVEVPGGPGTLARAIVRCVSEGGGSHLTFEEATNCVGLVTNDEHSDMTTVGGGWSTLNSAHLFYPPRTAPRDGTRLKIARALAAYDAQRRENRESRPVEIEEPDLATTPPPLTEPPTKPEAPLPTEPLVPTEKKHNFLSGWGTPKIVITTSGGVVTVLSGLALGGIYLKGMEMAEDINAGEYGNVGDPRLDSAYAEYERLGGTLPWAYGFGAAGLAITGVGLAVPVDFGSKHNNVKTTVRMTPTGIELAGTF